MPSGALTTQTTTQNRLQVFARAFKGYMGVMPLVTAALAPLLTFLKAIPTYEGQRTTLACHSPQLFTFSLHTPVRQLSQPGESATGIEVESQAAQG